MKFVTVRDLRLKAAQVWKQLQKEKERERDFGSENNLMEISREPKFNLSLRNQDKPDYRIHRLLSDLI